MNISDLFNTEQKHCPLCFQTLRCGTHLESHNTKLCPKHSYHFYLSVFEDCSVLQLDLNKYCLLLLIRDNQYKLGATLASNKDHHLITDLVIPDISFQSFDELESKITTLINFQ